jgi:hypothetical protein
MWMQTLWRLQGRVDSAAKAICICRRENSNLNYSQIKRKSLVMIQLTRQFSVKRN